MKKVYTLMILAAMACSSCSEKYDDSDVLDRLDKVEGSIEELESAMAELEKRMDAADTITKVEELKEGDEVVGYKISFTHSDPVTIYNGEDGANGENGADGDDGADGGANVSATESTDGKTVTIKVGSTEYTFGVASEVTLTVDKAHYDLNIINNAIKVSTTGDVKTLYAKLTDETGGSDLDLATKAANEWNIEVSDPTAEGEYTLTLNMITPVRHTTEGIIEITAVDATGATTTKVVTFEYEADVYTLSELSETTPFIGTEWTITDVTASSADDFAGLKALLRSLDADSSSLTLNFPNLTSVPDKAFYAYPYLGSVNLPKATSIGDTAFFECTYLKSVDMPKVTSIGRGVFVYCSHMTSLKIGSDGTTKQTIIYWEEDVFLAADMTNCDLWIGDISGISMLSISDNVLTDDSATYPDPFKSINGVSAPQP